MSQWPIRFLNNTGDILPAFGLMRLHDGARLGPGELVLTAELVEADGEEGLYVNSPLDAEDATYGWCRSVKDPPFWVRYDPDNAPTAGDVIGPVEGETFASSDGDGFVVLYVDTDKGLARCDTVGAGTITTDDGFPPGTGGCGCGNCIAGITIPDGTECCVSHTQFYLGNPWLACEDTGLTLEYIGHDEWLTEPFDGPDCDGNQNEYRWHLTIDVDGRSYLTLDLETDNGCDPVCVIYWRDGFDCQCDNAFSLLKPYGKWGGVPRNELSCYACIKPVGPSGVIDELDLTVSPISCGFDACASDVEIQDVIEFANQLAVTQEGFSGLWCLGFQDEEGGFQFTKGPSERCQEGDPDSFFVDADVNGTWFPTRNGGAGCYLPAGRSSLRLGGLADSVCATWSTTAVVGHFGLGGYGPDCDETQDVAGPVCVKLMRLGCDYWFEVAVGYPTSDSLIAGGAITYYSDVGSFTEAGSLAADILEWFNAVHDLTMASNCPTCQSDTCSCADPGYADPTCGTATLMTSATFLDVPPVDPPSPSDTGVCDETCDPPGAPTNPSGSCCFEGECYSFWDEALCNSFGGQWDSTSNDCAGLSSCEESLACCVAGTCVAANGYECDLLGGTSTAGDCNDGVCEEGACCDASDGTCSLQQAADCVSPNYFWGAGTECDPDPCPDLGACCQNDDDQGLDCGAGVDCKCVLKLEADCIGTFAGEGTNCTTSTGCDCRAATCDFL